MNKVVVYSNEKADLDVKIQNEDVWLNKLQLSELFGKDRSVIQKHISQIYKEKELSKDSTCAKNAQVQIEGGRSIKRSVDYYNLDMIISVGYRVKSKQAIKFRIWATSVLKEYIKQKQKINYPNLNNLYEMQDLMFNTITKHNLASDEAIEIMSIIKLYTKSFITLSEHDNQTLQEPKGTKARIKLDYNNLIKDIELLKAELIKLKQTTDIFAILRDKDGLKSILNTIDQTFDGKELYESFENKAAHLLYLIIKNHPFVEGNKRVAAFVFIAYIMKNNATSKVSHYKINESGLVALTLLIAESKPNQKDTMIKLIQNLLVE